MLIKNYKGKIKTKNGLSYGLDLDWVFVNKIIDFGDEEEDYVKIDKDILTIYTDDTYTEEFCTYEYVSEYDVFISNQDDKYKEVIKIISMEREQFFSLASLKKTVGDEVFYVTIEIENLNKKGIVNTLINDCPMQFLQFPNSVEELIEIFPFCKRPNQNCKYTMIIRLQKGSIQSAISSIIKNLKK